MDITEIEKLKGIEYWEGLNLIYAYYCGNDLKNWKWSYKFHNSPEMISLIHCIN